MSPVWALVLLGCVALPACPCKPCVVPPTRGFVDPEIVRLTVAQRRADLAFLQALLEHSYPHLAEKQRRFGVQVSTVIDAHRAAVLRARNRYQYMNAVDRMLLAFHDGHLTTRGYRRTFKRTYRASHATPRRGAARRRPRPRPVRVGVGLTFRYVEGKVVVVRVRPGSTGERAGVRPGDVILLVGHRPALSRLGSSLRWRGWARLAAGLQFAASRVMIARPWYPDTPLPTERLLIQRNTRRLSLTLAGGRTPPRDKLYFGLRTRTCPNAKGRVGVLRVSTFVGPRRKIWKRLQTLLSQAKGLDALVVDIRGNRGGSQGVAHRLVARLIRRQVVAGEYRYLRTEVLARRVPVLSKLPADPKDTRWTTWQKDTIEPAPDRLGMPVAALVDEVCASSCETVARALSAAPGIKLYGRPTAGSSGLPVRVVLPHSRLLVSLPSWQSRTVTGRLIEGNGVAPQVHVPLRVAPLRAGRDVPLERATADLCKALASGASPK